MATPSKEWKETIAPDEDERFERLARDLHEVQRDGDRTLHAKGFGLEAELEVLGELPEHARAGLFARPGRYATYVRFSNGSPRKLPDDRGDVRGVAMKIVGVDGKKIILGMEDARTQDFLFIHTPSVVFRTPEEFVRAVRAAMPGPIAAFPKLLGVFGLRIFGMLPRLSRTASFRTGSVATMPFFMALPIRYGEYAAQLALAPHAKDEPPPRAGADGLHEELAERLEKGPVVFDVYARFYVDEASTPIEDPTVEWSADAPETIVARLTLAKQDLRSARAKKIAEYIETLSFDPWHALALHRPLGAMMRARKHAYRVSTQSRKAAPEPDGSETFGPVEPKSHVRKAAD